MAGREQKRNLGLTLLAALPMMTWGQASYLRTSPYRNPSESRPALVRSSGAVGSPVTSSEGERETAEKDLRSCHVHEVESLPGSHQFGSDFIETLATDPDPKAKDPNVVWGLTADLSTKVPSRNRAMYISKSTDGGETWTQVARVDSRYFNAGIGEGERNGLGVSPGGTDFVITTQLGAFQILPRANSLDPDIKPVDGILVPQSPPKVSIPKRPGDPVKAGVILITPDGKHMIIGYGYFDREPQIFTYHRGANEVWIKDGPLPRIPTEMDILSMQFGDPERSHPHTIYVGTGDQAFRFDFRTMQWTQISGVGADSAIQGISMVGGPHLAACWGVYNPTSRLLVRRVTNANFLLHRDSDQSGPNIRAFGIEVDPLRPNREVVTAITGVYASEDNGKTWLRLNQLPDGEFRSAHFNANGTVIVSGVEGTFLANPFSKACSPHLETREK